MKPLSVLLVEDSALFRSALEAMLRRAGFQVFVRRSRAGSFGGQRGPCVVLLDVVTLAQGRDGLERLVRRWVVCGPVLLLGRDDHITQLLAGLHAGAAGCINQTAPPKQVQKAIITLARGGSWIERSLLQKILERLLPASPRLPRRLSKRENEVLRHLAHGQTNRQIAQQLGLTEPTIKVYVSNLLRKTGTANRTDLSLYATRQGLIPA